MTLPLRLPSRRRNVRREVDNPLSLAGITIRGRITDSIAPGSGDIQKDLYIGIFGDEETDRVYNDIMDTRDDATGRFREVRKGGITYTGKVVSFRYEEPNGCECRSVELTNDEYVANGYPQTLREVRVLRKNDDSTRTGGDSK